MTIGRKIIIFWIVMMFVTAGCSSAPLTMEEYEFRKQAFRNIQQNSRDIAEAAERFDSIGRAPQQQMRMTTCKTDGFGTTRCFGN